MRGRENDTGTVGGERRKWAKELAKYNNKERESGQMREQEREEMSLLRVVKLKLTKTTATTTLSCVRVKCLCVVVVAGNR